MLTIGIDFDETLVSSFIDNEIIDKYNTSHGKNINEFDLRDYYFDDHEGFHDVYWAYYSNNYGNLPFYEKAVDVVKKLKNAGNKIYIITSRPINEKEKTNEQLLNTF